MSKNKKNKKSKLKIEEINKIAGGELKLYHELGIYSPEACSYCKTAHKNGEACPKIINL